MKRAMIIFDGSNFYHKIKSSHFLVKNTTYFDYRYFAEYIANGYDIVLINYYIGKIHASLKDLKGQALRINQHKLFSHLESNNQRINIVGGFLMMSNGAYHEKGVDVNMAVDLLVGAFKNIYDKAFLISSDTDLIPAIEEVRKLNKEVEYIGFQNSPSLGLIKYCNTARLLSPSDLKLFEKAGN